MAEGRIYALSFTPSFLDGVLDGQECHAHGVITVSTTGVRAHD